MSVYFPTLDEMLRNRRVVRRADGSYAEDSYDYGVWWRDDRGGVYRLTWIGDRMRDRDADPGELYLARLSGPTRVGFDLGGGESAVAISAGRATGSVELLCCVAPVEGHPTERLDAILDGWADVCGETNSVAWVRDRVAEALEARWATRPTVESCARCGERPGSPLCGECVERGPLSPDEKTRWDIRRAEDAGHDDRGFEGVGDFYSDDPYERYIAHQAAKGR